MFELSREGSSGGHSIGVNRSRRRFISSRSRSAYSFTDFPVNRYLSYRSASTCRRTLSYKINRLSSLPKLIGFASLAMDRCNLNHAGVCKKPEVVRSITAKVGRQHQRRFPI
jgi:hypothetical protein